MKHERIIAKTGVEQGFLDRFQTFQIEVLFAFEFVSAMGISNGNRERIHAGQFHEFDRLVGMGVNAALGITATLLAVIMLRSHEHAEFALNDAVMFVGVFDHFSAELDILVERFMAPTFHEGSAAVLSPRP